MTRKQTNTHGKTAVSLTRIQISRQPKVTSFLNVIGRNSLKTKKNYETGLVHFQDFLNDKYGIMHSLETIIEAILKNQVDPYALIDDFVSFEVSNVRIVRGKEMIVLPQTIRTLQQFVYDLAKSDLAYYYKQCIDGIEEVKRKAWEAYRTDDASIKPRDKLLALKLIKECDEAKFALFTEGPSVLNLKALEERLNKIETREINQ